MRTETPTITPLAATVARLAALDGQFAAEIGALEVGWFPATDLAAADATLLAEGLAREVARYPGAEQRVSGSFFIGHYAWYVAGLAIGCYLAERRAPDLAAENVALRFTTYTWHFGDQSGEAERLDLRLRSGRFAALPDDPAADHPDALILPDAAALREWLRARLEEHLAPLIEAISNHTGLGRRAQWNLAADSFAALFHHAGERLGDGEQARTEGLAFVKAPGSPLRNRDTGYVTLECQGHRETFPLHGGCCLYYKVEGGSNCSTCVLRPERQRNQMLLAYMAEKYAQEAER